MQLRFYDTLTWEKRPFVPLDANNVRMYACGPTVYDFAHIGNGRAAIVFDVLFRVLRRRYGADHVKYVRNITDVDDKINVRAARDYPGVPLNEAIRKVTEQTYQQYQDDVTALGCLAFLLQRLLQARLLADQAELVAEIGDHAARHLVLVNLLVVFGRNAERKSFALGDDVKMLAHRSQHLLVDHRPIAERAQIMRDVED